MARPLRIQGEGLTYHVTARGVGRMALYRADIDRREFLSRLADVADTHAVLVRSYCLMTTHYHLVMTTTRANVSDAAKQLNEWYAQRYNWRYDRVGHLFQGRFGGQLVQEETYLASVCRYVVLNPVRGGLVRLPEDWPWSSYQATIGMVPAPPFLDLTPLLGRFGGDDLAAGATSFRRFVEAGITGTPRLPATPILGDAAFAERFSPTAVNASREVPRLQRRFRPVLTAIFAGAVTRRARAARMAEAYAHGYAMAEIARYLEVHYTTVSKAIRSVRSGARS